MKKKKGGFLIGAGLLLIAAAALLGAYNVYDGYRAEQVVEEPVHHLEALLEEQQEDVQEPTVEQPVQQENETADVKPEPTPVYREELEIPNYILNPDMDMPVSNYDGQDYIGLLEIPALELKLPVISEWSYPRLRIAPCRYEGTAYKRNMIIMAHNYASHFGELNALQEGSAVIFTDIDGNRFEYLVELKETLDPYDVEGMKASGWDLTLFTCTPGGSYRVTVRCTQIEEPLHMY